MPFIKTQSRPRQRGITLIESLVALVVAALGILGIVGVQMRTLSDTQTTVRRAQAIRLIEDLSERLKVNPNAMASLSAYASDFSDEPSPGDCNTKLCTQAQLAAYDLGTWKQAVRSHLPLGQASIFLAGGETVDTNRRQLGVMIAWRENERDIANATDKKAYRDNIDATQVRAADGTLSAGSDQSKKDSQVCPDGSTCHLQYISVAARCAPYLGGGSIQFYCAGA